MIVKLLLITQMIWMIFIKLLNNIIQVRNVKDRLNVNPLVTKLSMRDRKLNISLITQSYFAVPKYVRLIFT